jgi:hypothetical protein
MGTKPFRPYCLPWVAGGLMTKSQSDVYREKAAECMAAADKAVDPPERIELVEIAQAYLRLAERAFALAPKSPTE